MSVTADMSSSRSWQTVWYCFWSCLWGQKVFGLFQATWCILTWFSFDPETAVQILPSARHTSLPATHIKGRHFSCVHPRDKAPNKQNFGQIIYVNLLLALKLFNTFTSEVSVQHHRAVVSDVIASCRDSFVDDWIKAMTQTLPLATHLHTINPTKHSASLWPLNFFLQRFTTFP